MAKRVFGEAITIDEDNDVCLDGGQRVIQRMGPRRVEGFRLLRESTTVVRIRPGEAEAKGAPVRIRLATNRDVNLAVTGANGLDVGTKAANSWYWLFVIKGTAGTESLASLSRLTPTLPSGYTSFRRVGVVRTNAAGNIRKFEQIYMEIFRRYIWKDNWATVLAKLTNGQSITWADVDCSDMIPPSAELGEYSFIVRNTGAVAPRLYIRPKGANYDALRDVRSPDPAGRQCICEIPPGNNQTLQYHVDDAGDRASIHVLGFTENVRE